MKTAYIHTVFACLLALAGPTQARPGVDPPWCRAPMPGQHVTYAFDYRNEAMLDLSPVTAGRGQASTSPPQALTTRITGRLDLTVYKSGSAGSVLGLRFEPQVSVAADGRHDDGLARRAEAVLRRGFLVDTAPDGQVRRLRFPPATTEAGENFACTLVSLGFDVVIPRRPSVRGWRGVQQDPNGAYLACYRLVGDAGGTLTVEKVTARYLTGPGATTTFTPHGTLRGVWRDGLPVSIHGTQALEVAIGGRTAARSVTRWGMDLTGAQQTASADFVRDRRTVLRACAPRTRSLYAPPDPAAEEAAVERAALGETRPADLQAALARLDAAPAPDRETIMRLYLKVKALAAVRPGDCQAFATPLRAEAAGRPSFLLIAGALGAAATPAAQHALASSLLARRDPIALQVLLSALATAAPPTAEAEAAVRSEVSSNSEAVRTTAALGLGQMACHLRRDDPARARRIVGALLNRLARETGPGRACTLLMALGNARSPYARPALVGGLAARDAQVRLAALNALWQGAGDAAKAGGKAGGSDTDDLRRRTRELAARDRAPEIRRAAQALLRGASPSGRGAGGG